MATYSRKILSSSTNGKGIKIAQTASTGTLLHTGSTSTSVTQEVWLYAVNADTTARKLTIQYGGTATPDDDIELTIPAESGLTLVTPGLPLKGATTALEIRAYAATANLLMIHGYVNEVS